MKIEADRIEAGTFHGMPVIELLRELDIVLSKGHRAEVIPTKDGVRVMHVKRETVKNTSGDKL